MGLLKHCVVAQFAKSDERTYHAAIALRSRDVSNVL